jgi:glutamyl-tRNA synthetase
MAEQSMHVFIQELSIEPELAKQHFNQDVITYLKDFVNNLPNASWDDANLTQALNQTLNNFNIKMPQLAPAIRLALTGSTNAPSVPAVLQMVGKEIALKRLNNVLTC